MMKCGITSLRLSDRDGELDKLYGYERKFICNSKSVRP